MSGRMTSVPRQDVKLNVFADIANWGFQQMGGKHIAASRTKQPVVPWCLSVTFRQHPSSIPPFPAISQTKAFPER